MSDPQGSSVSPVPGLAVGGGILCGVAGFVSGLVAMLHSGDFVGGGVCLLAGALAFGLVAGAVLRD